MSLLAISIAGLASSHNMSICSQLVSWWESFLIISSTCLAKLLLITESLMVCSTGGEVLRVDWESLGFSSPGSSQPWWSLMYTFYPTAGWTGRCLLSYRYFSIHIGKGYSILGIAGGWPFLSSSKSVCLPWNFRMDNPSLVVIDSAYAQVLLLVGLLYRIWGFLSLFVSILRYHKLTDQIVGADLG